MESWEFIEGLTLNKLKNFYFKFESDVDDEVDEDMVLECIMFLKNRYLLLEVLCLDFDQVLTLNPCFFKNSICLLEWVFGMKKWTINGTYVIVFYLFV